MIFKNIPLKKYNTFGLDYMAECMIKIKTEKEAAALSTELSPGKNRFLFWGVEATFSLPVTLKELFCIRKSEVRELKRMNLEKDMY